MDRQMKLDLSALRTAGVDPEQVHAYLMTRYGLSSEAACTVAAQPSRNVCVTHTSRMVLAGRIGGRRRSTVEISTPGGDVLVGNFADHDRAGALEAAFDTLTQDDLTE